MTDATGARRRQLYRALLDACERAGGIVTPTTREHLRSAAESMTPAPVLTNARWTWLRTQTWTGYVLEQGDQCLGYVQRITEQDGINDTCRWQPFDATGRPLTTAPIAAVNKAREAVQRFVGIPADAIAYQPRARGVATITAT